LAIGLRVLLQIIPDLMQVHNWLET